MLYLVHYTASYQFHIPYSVLNRAVCLVRDPMPFLDSRTKSPKGIWHRVIINRQMVIMPPRLRLKSKIPGHVIPLTITLKCFKVTNYQYNNRITGTVCLHMGLSPLNLEANASGLKLGCHSVMESNSPCARCKRAWRRLLPPEVVD